MTIQTAEVEKWEKKLENKIISLLQRGIDTFEEVLPLCDGAQPKDVYKTFNNLIKNDVSISPISPEYKTKFFFKLPAANPLFFQWWYTLESQETMACRILDIHQTHEIACLGTPTLAATIAAYSKNVTLFDIDKDIVSLFNSVFNNGSKAQVHDVNEEISNYEKKKFDCIAIDPPWYPSEFKKFISRAIELAKDGALIYCSIPQSLTRPGIEEEREELISSLQDCGHKISYIEPNVMKYIVPYFEEEALKNSGVNASNQPWRSSDLLVINVRNSKTLNFENRKPKEIRSYSRKNNNSVFRIFLEMSDIKSDFMIYEIDKFSSSISQRDCTVKVNLWTSDKKGFQVGDTNLFNNILKLWSEGKNIDETIDIIRKENNFIKTEEEIKRIVTKLEELTEIWDLSSESEIRRTSEEIKLKNDALSSEWASESSDREHGSKSDGFRIEFQRDRDRIIWSNGFRKLADKTQLFPLEEDEHLRQRLAHSIEVMQLASTIGAAFGLDKDLIEAGSLAHDIGHTPFGHAGEHAIDRMFKMLGFKGGFNHYEHGVDVVRFLEGSYQFSVVESHNGLNLTPEVCDCILKHTYCHKGEGPSQENIWKYTKHRNYLKCGGYSHLEGQAVRAADKISYLLSDIEDGIKLGAIQLHDLLGCRLFHRSPIDFRMRNGDNLYSKFLEQRGSIIKLLMEDIILESTKRISKLKSKYDVFKSDDYCIFHSGQIDNDMGEVWNKIQVAKLHLDPRVLSANMKASKMVSELLLMLTLFPEHINEQFKIEHERLNTTEYMKYYRDQHKTITIPPEFLKFLPLDMMIGFKINSTKDIDVYHLVLAKDYVASLTDKKLNKIYYQLLG
ncbi:dNTP triphosphohydrolase [Shewanella corallii]|uniref:DNTP triphosphohydrolase n=1 Tax=Shewanella corallii TaxID=560080 RepID=A0ABT0N3I8_9GAMM|nr:dNTP triphosphohydrolase [Shewanella corallii]MCL2913018.1 dNTP triphosphohydrolase [Shewanella corallii]